MDIDYNRPSAQILHDLLFYTSGTAIAAESLVFGKPETFGPFDGDRFKRDTRVRVSVAESAQTRMRGMVTLHYARLFLDDFVPKHEQTLIEVATLPFTTYQILPMLNARYGLALDVDDVEDTVFTEDTPTFRMVAKASSLVWQGGLEFETTYEEKSLELLIKVRDLNGLWPLDGLPLEEEIPVSDLLGFDAA